MKRAWIFGAAPFDYSSLDQSLFKGDTLVAADGGYRYFLSTGIEPDLFVGDFDTLKKGELQKPKRILPLNPVKDDTDTLFAIKALLKEGYDTFVFVGCLGGRIDQSIASIQYLLFLKENKGNGILLSADGKEELRILKDSSLLLSGKEKYRYSLFSLSKTSIGVTESNCFYPLKDKTLTDSYPLGVSNECLGEGKNIPISVKKGTLLLVLPLIALEDPYK